MKYSYSPYTAGCPVCSNTENKLLYKVTSEEAAIHFFSNRNPDDRRQAVRIVNEKIAMLWNSTSAAVVLCANCGFTFADPFVAGDYEFYNLLPHSTKDHIENWKWEFEKTFKRIPGIASNNPDLNFLEIGASMGDFSKRVAGIIPKENILCLEYSEIGLRCPKNAGIEAYPWDFRDLGNKTDFANKFDIVCLFQVLEHLDKLDETFKTFNAISKPGAHLFIGVPNGRKIKFNELKDGLLDMPPNHIGRYNQEIFEHLGNQYGWRIEEIAIEPFSALDVMKTVMFYQSLKRTQFPTPKETISFRVKRYIGIKYMRLQAFFLHRQLGEALWVHYKKIS